MVTEIKVDGLTQASNPALTPEPIQEAKLFPCNRKEEILVITSHNAECVDPASDCSETTILYLDHKCQQARAGCMEHGLISALYSRAVTSLALPIPNTETEKEFSPKMRQMLADTWTLRHDSELIDFLSRNHQFHPDVLQSLRKAYPNREDFIRFLCAKIEEREKDQQK